MSNKLDTKAAVLIKKRIIKLININLKKPKKGQALVKILYSGICASQHMEFNFLRGPDRWIPHMLGHEGVGIVEEIGRGVKRIKKGDRVILSWLNNNNKDVKGSLIYNKKKINYGPVTTFANYSLISENRLYKIPKSMDLETAALYGCAIPTGMGVVINEAKPKKIDVCLVAGLGGVGMFSLIALKSIGIKHIIGLDINNKKIKLLKSAGFKNLINVKSKNYLRKINKITNNKTIDYIFDCTGSSKSIEKNFDLLGKNGKLFFCSHPKFGEKISIDPHQLISGKNIYGSWGGGTNLDRDLSVYRKIIKKTKIKLRNFFNYSKLENLDKDLKSFNKINKSRTIIKMKH